MASDSGEAPPSVAAADSADDLALFADLADDDEFDDWERFDPYGDLGDLEELPPLPEADVHLLSEQHKRPVSEPPPGYQLHKLRRGGS